MDVGRHPNVTLLTYSEVENVSGYVGNFKVTVRKKARYVDENLCSACGDCVKVCPSITPDEYQQGLSSRRAIYIQYPQAVPSAYVIDMNTCLGTNPIACGKCSDVCEKHAIDYDMQDRLINLEIGTIIVATGMGVYDPTEIEEYGYGKYANVITSMEFERLICAGGPTEGHFVRPGDKKRPKRIGFIQCVGSRSKKYGSEYCSNICCMNTVKDTLLLRDHYPDTENYVFYMDIRAFGKGFEDMYMRSKEVGVKYIRGIPGEITNSSETGNLKVAVENTLTGQFEEYEFDMVVLSVGVKPQDDSHVIRKLLTLSKTSDGFLMEAHPKLKPVDAPTKGVFFAGCVESPKDIKDSVTQASAAAARAQILLNAGKVKIEAITSRIDTELCKKCGLCAGVCPYGAIKWSKGEIPTVIEAACAGCGCCGAECNFGAITMRHFTDHQIVAQIDAILEKEPMKKLVTFACNWCSYAGGDFAGISRLQYPVHCRLIRTMCSARVQEDFIIQAFMRGAPMVLVSGCHFADCHYINANRATVRRAQRLWDKMEKLGIRPERLQLEWISAAEGQKFAAVMRKLDEKRKDVNKAEVDYAIEVLKADMLKGDAKKAAMEKLKSPRVPEKTQLPPIPEGHHPFKCMSCGHVFTMPYDLKEEPFEWSCPLGECKSNSIRRLKG
ncbi:MAG: methyl-viologen-reducing hydrogenase subunit delta [Ignavibacteria bacterium RBG_13_36_8]|nr:MAG: methyl-viologen-reducing hydrogenase subunit delta [Ignavibacteria bacterium RBG_13_36_8]